MAALAPYLHAFAPHAPKAFIILATALSVALVAGFAIDSVRAALGWRAL